MQRPPLRISEFVIGKVILIVNQLASQCSSPAAAVPYDHWPIGIRNRVSRSRVDLTPIIVGLMHLLNANRADLLPGVVVLNELHGVFVVRCICHRA